MLPFLKKWFRSKRRKPQQKRGGKVVTGPERLIPLIAFSRSRRTRQALLGLEDLDPRCRSVLRAMQGMTNEEILGPRKRWSDPY
jgi:hypothetical protein